MAITINVWAVLVSAILYFFLGALWYSPLLFARPWARLKGIDMDSSEEGPTPWMFIGSFVGGLVLTLGVAVLLSLVEPASFAGALALVAGAGLAFVAAPMFASNLFGGDLRLWLIDSGYPFVAMIIAGAILHAWV